MQSDELEPTVTGQSQPRSKAPFWLVLGCLTLAACLTCLVVITATGIIIVSRYERSTGELLAAPGETATPLPAPKLTPAAAAPPNLTLTPSLPLAGAGETIATPEQTEAAGTAVSSELNVPAVIRQSSPPEDAFRHLASLLETDYPARDYYDAAGRLGHVEVGQRTVSAQSVQVGDRRNFVTDDGLRESVLMAVTDHAYFWVETTLDYDPARLAEAAQRFEADYYPVVVKLSGTDWQSGVDDDPRFSVLHLDGYADDSELGFFNSGDQYPRSVNIDSNEQEVIYLNMENLRPGESLYFGTLVHELQHLIQWHNDPNEPVWLSEGLAQFTELYAGLDTVDTPPDYLDEPGTRLNTWLYDAGDEVFAHYGAAYLFVVYFWEQLGDSAIQRLMQHPADGLAGVSAVLRETDPQLTLDQFILDWATANYLDKADYGPRYAYDRLDLDEPAHVIEIDQAPFETLESMDQFGVSYVQLDLKGQHSLAFAGDAVAELLPASPHSGEAMWYVPALNELDAQLTASFDLTEFRGAELSFWAWYELEDGYDFAYVSISTDGGVTWDLLMPDHAEAGEYGPALSGHSNDIEGNGGGWVEETVSLSAYTGGQALIRFEVLSDSAIAESGFAIDDIAISELGFLDDAESENDAWRARGFVRTGQFLPQIWRLNLILHEPSPQGITLELNDRSQGKWTIDLGAEGGVLVITAQTPFVSEPADYWLAIDP